MTLSLYVARRFLGTFLIILGVFAGMLMLLDMVEQLRRMAGRDGTFAQAAQLAALNMPAALYQILPLIVILATIALFLALARSSELVVVRAAGRSAIRLALAPVAAVLVVGALALAVFNPLVAATMTQYDALSDRLTTGTARVLSVGDAGLWMRQPHEDGQMVIRAARADPDGTRFHEVGFVFFDPDGMPVRRIEAQTARLGDAVWSLTLAKDWDLRADNPERRAQRHTVLELPATMTPAQLRDSFGSPASISIWELPAFIERLNRAGFAARAHQVWLHIELATPLFMAGMVLLGAGFTMRPSRFGGTGIRVLIALLVGFGLYFLRNFAQVLGEAGQIPVLVAAWGPAMAAVLLSMGLLLHVEDG